MVRKEGFPGQRLARLTVDSIRKAARHPLLAPLRVTAAGRFEKARGHAIDRPEGVEDAILILCRKGEGSWKLSPRRGERVEGVLREGEILWIPARIPHAYASAPSRDWSIEWAHVAGSETVEWATLLGAGEKRPVLAFETAGVPALAFQEVYDHLARGDELRHQIAAAQALRRVFAHLSLSLREGRDRGSAGVDLERVVAWMREHVTERPTLADLAFLAGCSVPHFSALFRASVGESPGRFHRNLGVRSAADLLVSTGLSITEVARRVGYEDPLHFSRVFRKALGVSPETHRRSFGRSARGSTFPPPGTGSMRHL